MLDLLLWAGITVAVVLSITRKSVTPFRWTFLLYAVAFWFFFAYESLYNGRIVDRVYDVLPFNLLVLACVMGFVGLKIFLKYEIFKDRDIAKYTGLGLAGLGFSHLVGVLFLGYSSEQFVTGSYFVFIGISYFFVSPKLTGFQLEVIVLAVLLGCVIGAYILAIFYYGQFQFELFSEVILKSSGMIFAAMIFILFLFAQKDILNKQKWDRFASFMFVFVLISTLSTHPELKVFSTPLVKAIMDGVNVVGSFGTVGYAVAAVAKARLAMVV